MSGVLAFDCGGSRTRAGVYDTSGTLLSAAEGGPANPVAGGLDNAVAQIARLAAELNVTDDTDIAAGVAGARDKETREALWTALASRFPGRRIVVCDDQTPVLLANHGGNGAILITAGTGSCVLAVGATGVLIRKGGRGPFLGDDGSAYAVAADALKRAARAMDGATFATSLSQQLPAAAGLNHFDDLIEWRRRAKPNDVAALAEVVCAAALEGDSMALDCLYDQAAELVSLVEAARVAAQLPRNAPIFLNGGLFEHSESYLGCVAEALMENDIEAVPELASLRGHAAVHAFAEYETKNENVIDRVAPPIGSSRDLPATERRAEGPALDSLDAAGIVEQMIKTNDDVDEAMAGAAEAIAEAVDCAATALDAGGRIIYAGAGTSGRLAVLDAAECRPTFGVESGTVIALIAGGDRALVESVEEAEDSRDAGRDDLAAIQPEVNAQDFVVGITASGTTPYPCAVVEQAAEQGARTALLTCNAESPDAAPLMIRLVTGPEALPGSTRLKAGTATKLALNIISTGAFARAGHIYDGWMVGVRPTNAKLRARAARIIGAITALDESSSRTLLEDAGNCIPVALVMNRFQLSRNDAEARLEAAENNLRAVLDA